MQDVSDIKLIRTD